MSIAQRLAALGLNLPESPQAIGQYQPWVKAGCFIFISGQFPLVNGVLKYPGKLGESLDDTDGYEAARLAGINVLAQLRDATQQFERLDRIVRLDGHIQCAPNWFDHAKVLDGASDLFAQVLNDRLGHARTAFGQIALPLNASVELVATAVLKSAYSCKSMQR